MVTQKKNFLLKLTKSHKGVGAFLSKILINSKGFTKNSLNNKCFSISELQSAFIVLSYKIQNLRIKQKNLLYSWSQLKLRRGVRYSVKLPVNGQRTKTNASNAKKIRI